MKSPALGGEMLAVLPASMIAHSAELAPERFRLMIPLHWKPEVEVNRHAKKIEEATLRWFAGLGCTEAQIRRVTKFQPSLYMGMSFPLAGFEEALLISKYLSLWLLWDDIDVESQENAWRLTPHHVFSGELPEGATVFDRGWWELLTELSKSMSPAWMARLCLSMEVWSDAALREARLSKQWNEGARVTLAEALRSRIDTIGMYATSYLLEYAIGYELPKSFHELNAVRRMKTLANKIVGLGNDLFSFGKDYASDYINVISAMRRERSISTLEAIEEVVDMHNDALLEFDVLAASLPSLGAAGDAMVARWLAWLRHSCIGFGVWESVAPRYAEFRLLVNGRRVETAFVYYADESHRPASALLSELRDLAF